MKYLEDTLAEQCLSKVLYPNTKIIVTRKKVEGTLLTYTNELEVEVDFSDVDPSLLENQDQPVPTLNTSEISNNSDSISQTLDENSKDENQGSSKSSISGKASKFFKKKMNK